MPAYSPLLSLLHAVSVGRFSFSLAHRNTASCSGLGQFFAFSSYSSTYMHCTHIFCLFGAHTPPCPLDTLATIIFPIRYLFHDTWNLVDLLTIVMVSLAFIFRLLGMPKNGGEVTPAGHFFAAQFFLALAAPLLFARLMRLSQIDDTLGPMTQVI